MYADGFRVWYDVIEHESARVFTERIEEALRMHSRLLIVVSEASRKAEWLRTEFGRAFLKGKNGTIAIAHAISLLSPDDLLEWKCYVASCSRDLAEVQRRSGIPDFSRWEDPDSFERAYGQLAEALTKS
ncbi:TIR domain-containing protein [Singulisphaera sp. PoT]|uniref:TIR domain-containing protein n=1 Tax=Singulisphaera sp. PoT TaxID=3411797 RepID=UPI003BF5EF5B